MLKTVELFLCNRSRYRLRWYSFHVEALLFIAILLQSFAQIQKKRYQLWMERLWMNNLHSLCFYDQKSVHNGHFKADTIAIPGCVKSPIRISICLYREHHLSQIHQTKPVVIHLRNFSSLSFFFWLQENNSSTRTNSLEERSPSNDLHLLMNFNFLLFIFQMIVGKNLQ